jgi:hypothetical protein
VWRRRRGRGAGHQHFRCEHFGAVAEPDLAGPRWRLRPLPRQRPPYFDGIVRIGELDGDTHALEGKSEDFSVTIERAQ